MATRLNLPNLEGGNLRLFQPSISASCEASCVRQTSCPARFARVCLEIAPFPAEDIVLVENECAPEGQDGKPMQLEGIDHFKSGTLKGVTDVMLHYRSLNIGIVRAQIIVERMIVHPIDSSELAFLVATRNAVAAGLLSVALKPLQ